MLESIAEYLFDFSIYHARWDEIKKNDFKMESLHEKGAESRINVEKAIEKVKFDSVDIYSGEETVGMIYLRKIIEYCQNNEIDILLTYNPFMIATEDVAASKYVRKISDEYNIKYINFIEIDIISYYTDCSDNYSHLNVSGARKITDYLGKYIMEYYNIPDQRKNETYKSWYDDYDEYIDYKIYNLKNNEQNLNNYLMLLYEEKDIGYEIKISSEKIIEEGSILQKLLENLDNNYEINDDEFKEKQDKTIKITTYDNRNGQLIREVWF